MKGNKNDGLFVNAKIHNTEVHCLIDTGSTMSVLHTTVFDQLPGRLKNQLLPYHTHLRMADGSPVWFQLVMF
jgi:predicted aspartyl protease